MYGGWESKQAASRKRKRKEKIGTTCLTANTCHHPRISLDPLEIPHPTHILPPPLAGCLIIVYSVGREKGREKMVWRMGGFWVCHDRCKPTHITLSDTTTTTIFFPDPWEEVIAPPPLSFDLLPVGSSPAPLPPSFQTPSLVVGMGVRILPSSRCW